MRIVIIEDDIAIGFSLRLALEDRGHDVEVYADPSAVPFASLTAQVILLDYYMPKLNGEQVLHLLRKNSGLDESRIILMTASPHMDAVASALRVQLLPKPFDLETLYAKVEGP